MDREWFKGSLATSTLQNDVFMPGLLLYKNLIKSIFDFKLDGDPEVPIFADYILNYKKRQSDYAKYVGSKMSDPKKMKGNHVILVTEAFEDLNSIEIKFISEEFRMKMEFDWGLYTNQNFKCVVERASCLVIDIPSLENAAIQDACKHLQRSAISNAEHAFLKYTSSACHRIKEKLDSVSTELSSRIFELDILKFNIQETAQKRIHELPILSEIHLKDADTLVTNVTQMKKEYNEGISLAIINTQIFLKEIRKAQDLLGTFSNAAEVFQARKNLDTKAKAQTLEVKAILSKHSAKFEERKLSLLRSKEPGNHAAAWQIIIDSKTLGLELFSFEIERWKGILDEQIDVCFDETKRMLQNIGQEFDYYIQDHEFVEKYVQLKSRLRLRLRTESIKCKSRVDALLHLSSSLGPEKIVSWVRSAFYVRNI